MLVCEEGGWEGGRAFVGGLEALFPRLRAGCPHSQGEGAPGGLEGVGVCWGADYDFIGALSGEEAYGYYAGDLVYFGLEFYGVEDF